MEYYTAKVKDYSPESAQKAYAKACRFYASQGMEGSLFQIDMTNSGVCYLFFTDTERCWALLRKFMNIERMNEKEIEAETLAESVLDAVDIYYLFKDLASGFARFESEVGHNPSFGAMTYPEILKMNLRYFCYYIAATDGSLDYNETEIINTILDENLSQEETLASIQNANIVDDEDRRKFRESTMASFVIAALADKYFRSKGVEAEFVEAIRSLFRCTGIRISTVDGEVTQEELDSIDAVINNLAKVASVVK